MLKYLEPLNGTSAAIRQVAGLGLSYRLRGLTVEQRAVLAAAEFDDVAWALTEPTDAQLCALFDISHYQLRRGRKLGQHERWRVKVGFRHHLSDKAERLAKVVRAAGPDATWDALVNNLG